MEKKINRFKTLRRELKDVNKRERVLLWGFLVYTVVASIYPVIGVVFPKYIINGIQNGIAYEDIFIMISIMGGLLITFGGLQTYIVYWSQAKALSARLKEFPVLGQYYLNVNYEYMEDAKWNDKVNKATETLSTDQFGYQGVILNLFSVFALIGSVVIYIVIVAQFSLWILLVLLVGIALSIMSNKIGRDYEYKNSQKMTRQYRKYQYFNGVTSDFSFNKDIRIYSLKDKILKCFKSESLLYIRLLNRVKNKQFLLGIIDLVATMCSEGIAYYLLIRAVVDKSIFLGDFTMYVAAVAAISLTLRSVATNLADVYSWLGYTRDYYIQIDSSRAEDKGLSLDIKDTLEIEFKNVSFKYPNTDNYILKDFNLKIEKGTKLAIVGTNGAGKTTIIKLITGLFEVTEGEILINGANINSFNKHSLYTQFSVVFQDVNIYAFSILENVSMCPIDKTDRNLVIDVLKRVGIYEKIQSLPKGLETNMLKIIDEEGIELSGGQNQKLAIARALYHRGNCVILDEPTAALDALAEAEIYQEFNDLVMDKTAIYISHRLASTKFCDNIALFSKDGLLEYGTHDELMSKKGVYYEMFTVQGKYYQDGVENEKSL